MKARLRRRYVAFEVGGELSADAVRRLIGGAVRGVTPPPRFILFDKLTKRGLLRCGHLQVSEVKGALAGSKIKGASFKVLGVSGTIKASKRKFLAPQLGR